MELVARVAPAPVKTRERAKIQEELEIRRQVLDILELMGPAEKVLLDMPDGTLRTARIAETPAKRR
jgi:hypothetical protein